MLHIDKRFYPLSIKHKKISSTDKDKLYPNLNKHNNHGKKLMLISNLNYLNHKLLPLDLLKKYMFIKIHKNYKLLMICYLLIGKIH